MAEIVMILGESGSGKSASLRNFQPGEVCVLNVAGKRLPFRNGFGNHVVNVSNAANVTMMYELIKRAVRSGKYKRYVIDDSQYLMAFDAFDKAEEKGYGKFTDMAKGFYDLLRDVGSATIWERQEDGTYIDTRKRTDDAIVYFLHHPDRDDSGMLKPKTQGRMLDEKLNVAGLFTTVLLAETDGVDHWFLTQNDGRSVVKSPMGMFADAKIPNDLKAVDATIRAYYEMEG
ncbi:MAG: hypothetical protein E7321_00185 [Clostridiales bacterium]|nr:hypothetical protein [Clostridiales bacterium]